MTRYDRRVRLFAAVLAALAGYVDAIGFLELGGFFVSFMSGNSTRLAVGLAEANGHALVAGGLIAAFVGGVVLGSLVGRFAGEGRRKASVVATVAVLLAAAAGLGGLGVGPAAMALLAVAMGAENAVFQREGEVSIGLTYMTGTLVKLGQRLTDALLGGPRLGWTPYLLLWMGLVAGAAAGASIYPHLGLSALWPAAGAAALLAVVAARIGRPAEVADVA